MRNNTQHGRPDTPAPQESVPADVSATPVMIPQKAELPLPREPQHQVAVPVSINGHSLATGRP